MIPIQRLLARIRWDKAYADASFEIGYYDRKDRKILRVGLKQAVPDPDNPFLLQICRENASLHCVPLHRIRQVFRNGELIWQR